MKSLHFAFFVVKQKKWATTLWLPPERTMSEFYSSAFTGFISYPAIAMVKPQ